MKLKKKLIMFQLIILIVTVLIASILISTVYNYKNKQDTIRLFMDCKNQSYDNVNRIFINDSKLCLNCVNSENQNYTKCR